MLHNDTNRSPLPQKGQLRVYRTEHVCSGPTDSHSVVRRWHKPHSHTQLTLGEGLSRLPSFTMADEMTNAEVESSDKNILKN